MVDIGGKPITAREAIAEGFITLQPATIAAITAGKRPQRRSAEHRQDRRHPGRQALRRFDSALPSAAALESLLIDFELQDEKIHITATPESPPKPAWKWKR
jgi:cyclic pyranopterin phosphate synthase